MYKLQILIPQYKETNKVIKPLLDSIAIQQGIDFNDISVIIMNDGSDVLLNLEEFANYPFLIDYKQTEHGGVSHTRNELLNAATADYIMWCDADDMFCSTFGLYLILSQIEKQAFKILISLFYEEVLYQGKKYFIERKEDHTFVHGKVYDRKWLIDNRIFWNDNLTVHEDSYFNYLAQCYVDKENPLLYTSTPFYLWKWRDDSTVRRDGELTMLKTYNNFIDSEFELYRELVKREKTEEAEHFLMLDIFDAYYVMNKPEWINQDNANYRDATEKHFAEVYKEVKEAWDAIPENKKAKTSAAVRNKYIKEGMQMESLTIIQWLDEILKKAN